MKSKERIEDFHWTTKWIICRNDGCLYAWCAYSPNGLCVPVVFMAANEVNERDATHFLTRNASYLLGYICDRLKCCLLLFFSFDFWCTLLVVTHTFADSLAIFFNHHSNETIVIVRRFLAVLGLDKWRMNAKCLISYFRLWWCMRGRNWSWA